MNQSCLDFNGTIGDAISRIRFAPASNNLLISSWDSKLRLYDVDKRELRLEAPTEEAVLDCCFERETIAIGAGSAGSVLRYDMHLGASKAIGKHDDLATCIEYSEQTHQTISAGWDNKIMFWDARSSTFVRCLSNLVMEVESMSIGGFNLMVAARSTIHIFDLRKINGNVQAQESHMDIHIKCVREIPNRDGYAVGSIDGRVALEYLGHCNSKSEGYAFRCHPKDKKGRHHLVAVNDITFNPSINGMFATGDNEGFSTIWDAVSKKRLVELPRFPNSIASMSYNHDGQLLAIASSYAYQEANEREQPPQIFMHRMEDSQIGSASACKSRNNLTQIDES